LKLRQSITVRAELCITVVVVPALVMVAAPALTEPSSGAAIAAPAHPMQTTTQKERDIMASLQR
jgi:hypothetical protein